MSTFYCTRVLDNSPLVVKEKHKNVDRFFVLTVSRPVPMLNSDLSSMDMRSTGWFKSPGSVLNRPEKPMSTHSNVEFSSEVYLRGEFNLTKFQGVAPFLSKMIPTNFPRSTMHDDADDRVCDDCVCGAISRYAKRADDARSRKLDVCSLRPSGDDATSTTVDHSTETLSSSSALDHREFVGLSFQRKGATH